jgi:hypothetical protein
MTTAAHVLLDIEARRTVLRRLAEQYDEFATIEQELVEAGEYEAAEVAHDQAVRLLTAYNAEGRPQ